MAFLTQLNGVDPRRLGLLQRLLLINDGTLTDAVEAAMLEPIRLTKLGSRSGPVDRSLPQLDAAPGDAVMERTILLTGGRSGRHYVHAESQLALERLPADFRRELVESDKPMGRLWTEYRLETRKELLEVTRGPAPDLSAYFPNAEHTDMLSRRYRLISCGKPLMVITESFPARYWWEAD